MCSAFGLEGFPKGPREASSNPLVGTYRTSDDRFLMLVFLQSARYWGEFTQVVGRPELVQGCLVLRLRKSSPSARP